MHTDSSNRPSFEQFRSSTCHKLKDLGDIPFITQLLESNQIRAYYNRKWYPETLYLLAMLDHLSNINAIPLCCAYNDLRNAKLTQPLYPSEVLLLCELLHSDSPKEDALSKAIPEFLRFNIVECDIRSIFNLFKAPKTVQIMYHLEGFHFSGSVLSLDALLISISHSRQLCNLTQQNSLLF